MAQNLTEKIVERFAVGIPEGQHVRSGDFVTVRPAHVMTHDNTAAVMAKFHGLGVEQMADSSQPVFALDHNVQDRSEKNLQKYAAIEAFAAEHGINFHPAGRGIGHQVMCEEGFAWPGTVVVASDSHSNIYGGLGALGTPVVRTDAAALWAKGTTWWQVPPVARVELTGTLPEGASGKDVILILCGLFADDELLNHAIEFVGDGVAGLSIDQRLTIANMTTEWGALSGLFPCDATTVAWLRARVGTYPTFREERIAALEAEPLRADDGAAYAKVVRLDLSTVTPHVAGPHTVKEMAPIGEMEARQIPVQKAYLLSCVNGRTEDLAEAAAVLRGGKVADGVKLYIAAASDEVQANAEASGDWQALLDAGAIPLAPGCGPCIGLGEGLLEDGEVGISATNRNFKGRMGSASAEAYLASPAVVAASAAAGQICGPTPAGTAAVAAEIAVPPQPSPEATKTPILEGFPATLEGELLFCDSDNLNTDGIYPGKYTYREDLTRDEMAAVAMENYDAAFQELAQEGDLLVSGFNFGTGSSREQAATALQFRGIPCVIAGSYSATYKRNAFNNGYLLIDCPGLLEWLRAEHATDAPTTRTGLPARIDFAVGQIEVGEQTFPFPPLGPTAQELVVAGGLEALVKSG